MASPGPALGPLPRAGLTLALAAALSAPIPASAERSLLDGSLRAPVPAATGAVFPSAAVLAQAIRGAAAADGSAPGTDPAEKPSEGTSAAPPGDGGGSTSSLDFDLLGKPKPPPEPANAGALRLRRRMLGIHQGVGLGLLTLQLATTTVGQLNYLDRFAGGPDTGRYRLTHKALAYTTLGVFVANGTIALLAPSARTPRKLDRVMVHRVAMFTAAAGMAAQAVLGIATRERTGYLDQDRLATTHLVVGYVTLAAVLAGVGVFVF